jgi:oligoribonuclease (3'-5' exoribonuclease)
MSTLIFCDLETTGLDEYSKTGLVLELALVAVSEPDFTEIEHYSTPIRWAPEVLAGAGMDPFVVDMHTRSGLLAELQADPGKHRAEGGLPTRGQAQVEALAFINRHARDAMINERGQPEIVMCGSNPEFDRRWLKVHMPDLAAKFHYRAFDINSLWLLKRWLLGGERAKFGQAHRALADCREAVATVHSFIEAFGAPFMARIAELEAERQASTFAHNTGTLQNPA